MSTDDGLVALEQLDLTPSPRLLEVLGDIPYQPWQCIAELIDNAFDDFISDIDRDPTDTPTVWVTLPTQTTQPGDEVVCVADNGRGMTKETLERALRAGYSTNARHGSLGLFGMGFNIATARLGSVTEVWTTRSGDADWLVAEIDFRRMKQQSSFAAPLRRARKDDPRIQGSRVVVRKLKMETRDRLRRSQTATTIRERLGDVYSYLLRRKVPGLELPGPALEGKGFALEVNGTRVKPRLPCLWSIERVASYRGIEVPTVIEIDRALNSAWACMECGHWHHASPERCVNCEGVNLQFRDRRVTGWIGLQRYFDTSDFGIDLLRNGRKILLHDKSLFQWENPDTGEVLTEYPIELGATLGGRIVGEIHLDHVEVVYQKNDFERGTLDWVTAVHAVRGEGPLQPRKARNLGYDENRSPLGLIYHAWREVKPGVRNLIPGNGRHAVHDATRDWAKRFRKGQAEYSTDDRWYEAALEHDRVANGESVSHTPVPGSSGAAGGDSMSSAEDGDLLSRTGLGDDVDTQYAETNQSNTSAAQLTSAEDRETEDERYARYRSAGRQLLDLCADVSVGHLGRRSVVVYETSERLTDAHGQDTPCLSRSVRGNQIEIYVCGKHEVFRDYGRDPREYAIIELAQTLRAQAPNRDVLSRDGIARVAAQVTKSLPDQRFTDAAIRQRVAGLLDRVRDRLAPIAVDHADALWNGLPIPEKETAERNAEAADPRMIWADATSDGRFCAHIGPGGVAAIIRARPDLVLDGAVFATTWAPWNGHDARARQTERLARLWDSISEFISSTDEKSRIDLAMSRLIVDMLDQETDWEDRT